MSRNSERSFPARSGPTVDIVPGLLWIFCSFRCSFVPVFPSNVTLTIPEAVMVLDSVFSVRHKQGLRDCIFISFPSLGLRRSVPRSARCPPYSSSHGEFSGVFSPAHG